MKTKICTSLEQSKKLLELGLNPETADMYYTGHRGILDPKVTEYSKYPDVRHEYISFDHLDLYYPCWSLSALLELMPSEILINEYPTELKLEKTKIGYSFEYSDMKGHAQCFLSYPLMEGAVKMICWLIEQGYIKIERNE